MKKIAQIREAPPGHWVGDGFPVRSLISYDRLGQAISPFLLLDYAGPHHFEPASCPRGVGEHPHRGFENAPKTAGKSALINIEFTGTEDKYLLEMSNGVLNQTPGRHAEDADVSITLGRDTFNDIILKRTTLEKAAEAGKVEISGDKAKLEDVLTNLDTFDLWFNIVTP
jgi:hypothetical protein